MFFTIIKKLIIKWTSSLKNTKYQNWHGRNRKSETGSLNSLNLLLLLLLLSHFSRVRLCVTPSTAAHQAPLSLGFCRQEHWSGLPFPSPMHAYMLSPFSVSDSMQPCGQQPTRLLCPQDSLGKNTGMGCHFLLQNLLLNLSNKVII